jgi:hypothetical protein
MATNEQKKSATNTNAKKRTVKVPSAGVCHIN